MVYGVTEAESPVQNPASEPDLSGLPYTPSAPVYRPPSSVNPTLLYLLFLYHQTRTAISGSLLHQHHHPWTQGWCLHYFTAAAHPTIAHYIQCIQCTLHHTIQCTSGPPKGKPIPIIGIPPDQLSDTDQMLEEMLDVVTEEKKKMIMKRQKLMK